MGLYDDIRCYAKLPDDLPYNIPEDARWQTKSLDSTMDHYTIAWTGELTVGMSKWEDDPEEIDEHWSKLLKRRVPKKNLVEAWEEPVLYHGDIRFYNSFYCPEEDKHYHIELNARFTEGLLDRIWTCEIREINAPNRVHLVDGEFVPVTEDQYHPHEIITRKQKG